MNIVTPYPTNIPINTVNVTTESARRDNQLREIITKPSPTQAGVAERGLAQEHDKSKAPQPPASFEVNLRDASHHQKINERGQGQGEHADKDQSQGKDSDKNDDKKEAAKRRLSQVEGKLQQLDQQDLKQVRDLKRRDVEVRAHENAHAAAGGQLSSSPTYSFKRGPDGNNYAVGGEVQINTTPVGRDHDATVAKMQKVRAAALAPAEPSSQDRKVAAQASQSILDARAAQTKQKVDEQAAEQKAKIEKSEAEKTQEAAKVEETETAQASGTTQASDDTSAQAIPPQNAIDPFSLQGEQQARSVGDVFGVSGAPGGADRDQINVNRQASEQRNSEVVARASRVQNFYAASTIPRQSGFSQFA